MDRSRGELTTKIHAVVDASGLPLSFVLSPGQAHDSTTAEAMLEGHFPADSFLLGDKTYDAEWIRTMIEEQDAVATTLDRSNTRKEVSAMRLFFYGAVCLLCLTGNVMAQDLSELQRKYSIPEVISVYELEEHKVTLLISAHKSVGEEEKFEVLFQWAHWVCDLYDRNAVGPVRIYHRRNSSKGPSGNYYSYACAIR